MTSKFFTLFGILFILLFSFISFSGKIYYSLQPSLGVPWAYVLDQGIFLIIIILSTFTFLFVKNNTKRVFNVRIFKNHIISILVLLFSSFAVHGLLLKYYFFAEDIYTILSPVNNENINFPFTPLNSGYPEFPFVFSFLMFKTNATLYNIVSLLLFSFCVISLYWFAYLISRKKIFALLSGLVFVTTPSYIDMFAWQASVQGMSLTLALAGGNIYIIAQKIS